MKNIENELDDDQIQERPDRWQDDPVDVQKNLGTSNKSPNFVIEFVFDDKLEENYNDKIPNTADSNKKHKQQA